VELRENCALFHTLTPIFSRSLLSHLTPTYTLGAYACLMCSRKNAKRTCSHNVDSTGHDSHRARELERTDALRSWWTLGIVCLRLSCEILTSSTGCYACRLTSVSVSAAVMSLRRNIGCSETGWRVWVPKHVLLDLGCFFFPGCVWACFVSFGDFGFEKHFGKIHYPLILLKVCLGFLLDRLFWLCKIGVGEGLLGICLSCRRGHLYLWVFFRKLVKKNLFLVFWSFWWGLSLTSHLLVDESRV
jgi:hypothetical protein